MNGSRRSQAYAGAVLACVAALGGLLLWRTVRPAPPPQTGSDPVVVSVARVSRSDVPLLVTAIGNVQSLNNVILKPQISGVLTQVLVREGQPVQKGQLLASIDDRSFKAAENQAHAIESRDRANLKIAELDLKRDENLLAGEAIAGQTVDQQRALVEELKATVQSDVAAVQTAEVQHSYASIVSPITGRVGMRRVDPGNLVQANDANGLFSVVQVDPISVLFSLPQQDLPRLQHLLADPTRAEVTAFDRDAGTTLASGHLTNIDNQIDSATGTLQLRAEFANPQGKLWSGQFVTVELRTGVDRGASVLNSRAVQNGLDGNFVFRIKNGKAEVVPVKVRYVQGSVTTIGSGLEPGDLVVTDGQDQLTAGTAVRIAGTNDRDNDHETPQGGVHVSESR
jgi:membrane fusion protein, multidrug efflux system